MNRKQLVILLALAVVLGFAGLSLYRGDRSSWSGSGAGLGQKPLASLPVNDIASIAITSGSNSLVLAKTEGLWRVQQRNGYPANFADISALLIKLPDLKAVQVEEVGPSQLFRFGLLPPGSGSNTATLVEFKDAAGKTLNSLLLGKQHMNKGGGRPSPMGGMDDAGFPDGRYIQPAGAKTVTLVSETFQNVEPSPERWLNKDFFKVEKPKTITVTFPEATNSWKLARETEAGEWKLADAKPGEQLDVSKVGGVSSPLSYPSFNDVLPLDTQAATGLAQPTTLTVETFDGFTYTAKVGTKTNDNLYLTLVLTADLPKERTPGKDEKPEDKARLDKEFADKQKPLLEKFAKEQLGSKWVYLVPAYSVESILKPRKELLTEVKPETPASTPPPESIAAPPGK
jgi:hypothetical protein